MSKVKLASISSLTFYNGADTKARRTDPIPQLTCVGKPCKYYQPDVVRCKNDGGSGIDVDWKVYRTIYLWTRLFTIFPSVKQSCLILFVLAEWKYERWYPLEAPLK